MVALCFSHSRGSPGKASRFIGDHSGEYGDGDLVLVGPNLPHSWVSRAKIEEEKPHVALVLWFNREWLLQMTGGAVEFRSVEAMLQHGDNGLRFSETTAAVVRPTFETIFEKPPVERLLALLGILVRVAEDRQATLLASAPAQAPDLKESRERIDRILTHMHLHYAHAISLDELSDIAALSASGLHRMFRRHTGGTISDYLMRMRIGDACARLSSTDQAIHHISDAVGYSSLANFNRQFKALKNMTPREYQAMFLRR